MWSLPHPLASSVIQEELQHSGAYFIIWNLSRESVPGCWEDWVNMRVCFVLKLFSHTSLLMLGLTQMRRGISHGDQMMSTTLLLNTISYFLHYLQNVTNVFIVHRGVPLCTIWHQAVFQRNMSVVFGDGCHWCTHFINSLSISWGILKEIYTNL